MKNYSTNTTYRSYAYASIFILLNLFTISSINAQTVQIVLGTNNVPITEFKYNYNGSTVTKTSGGGTTVSTSLPVDLLSLKVTDGTTKTLEFFNFSGAYVANNNFTGSVTGVDVIDSGMTTSAANTTAFETKMNSVVNGSNLLCALLYDYVSNVPSGDDFDIRFARGLTNDDYVVVGERNGNTHFLVTPLDSLGNVITGASSLHFGNTTGTTSTNGNNRYDWNTTFAPNFSQPMYISVVDVSLFGTTNAVYGFRIDNNGEADVKFFGLSDNTFEDNPVNLAVPGIMGNIFNDSNGLNDATVDGQLIDSAGNSLLYVSLIQGGVVVATVPVDSNGAYYFLNIEAGTYTTVLHTTAAGSTTSSLPTNWVNTGENDGAGSGSDGSINGTSGSIVVTDSLETQINFGIEQLPDSDDKTFVITSPLENEVRDLMTGGGMGNLSGSDNEDGTYGSGGDFIITDTTGLNGNILFYDADGDGVMDVGEELYPNDTVTNYDPTKLSVSFVGMNSTSFTFNYSWIDSAGLSDPTPATYTASWSNPVPVTMLSFTAKLINDRYTLIKWQTATEINNDRFEILRSIYGEDEFKHIGTIKGNGTTTSIMDYSFIDSDIMSLSAGIVCYKLKQVDYDASSTFTHVECVEFESKENVIIYPNPTNNIVNVEFEILEKNATVELMGLDGKVITRKLLSEGHTSFDVAFLESGLYIIKVINAKQITTTRVIKY